MAVRSARTAWKGSLQEGSGQVTLTSSGVGTFDVSFPKRTADEAGGTTSPEELIAAAFDATVARTQALPVVKSKDGRQAPPLPDNRN